MSAIPKDARFAVNRCTRFRRIARRARTGPRCAGSGGRGLAVGLLLAVGGFATQPALASGAPFHRGDVFLTGSGTVREYSPRGRLVEAVQRTSGASVLCFDPSGQHLILPGVGLFDSSGNVLPSHWASVTGGYHCVADRLGDVYVSSGSSSTGWVVTKYDLEGKALQTFDLALSGGAPPLGIDLAPDGCTLYYGAWASGAGRLNVCTRPPTQESALTSYLDDVSVLPSGQILTAIDYGYQLYDASGDPIREYGPNYSLGVPSLSLDPDHTSFWIAGGSGASSPLVLRFDIGSGRLLSQWPGAGPVAVYSGRFRPYHTR